MKATRLFAIMATVLLVAACNKENEVRPNGGAKTRERDITYTVAERTTTVHLRTDAEFDALLEQFCDYAQEGNSVTFYNTTTKRAATKDVTNYSTTDRNAMIRWMRQMEDAGMTVTVTYDSKTDTWHGTAYTTAQPTVDGDYWVNLGLPSGLLWASCNVGASLPEERGDYFAWGETVPKEVYNWNTYAHGTQVHLTKYCSNSRFGNNGYTDTLTVLEPCDDAATVNIGGGARTATILEWIELVENTTSVWDTVNGVVGRRFVSTNGNSIFLPTTGYISELLQDTNSRCIYWSASLDIPSPGGAYYFHATSSGIDNYYPDHSGYRFIGLTVRPVRQAQ